MISFALANIRPYLMKLIKHKQRSLQKKIAKWTFFLFYCIHDTSKLNRKCGLRDCETPIFEVGRKSVFESCLSTRSIQKCFRSFN